LIVCPTVKDAMYFEILPVGYDLMRRSKCPGWWSPETGVYDRTISLEDPSG
jgi:hypothetical protein